MLEIFPENNYWMFNARWEGCIEGKSTGISSRPISSLQYPPEQPGWGTAPTGKGGGRVGTELQLLKAHWRNGATQTGHVSSRARTKCDLQVAQVQGREQLAGQQLCQWHRDNSGTQGKQAVVMLCHCDKRCVLGCINRAIMCERHEIILPIWSW